eukprot:1859000-Rhodomonas_salina.1
MEWGPWLPSTASPVPQSKRVDQGSMLLVLRICCPPLALRLRCEMVKADQRFGCVKVESMHSQEHTVMEEGDEERKENVASVLGVVGCKTMAGSFRPSILRNCSAETRQNTGAATRQQQCLVLTCGVPFPGTSAQHTAP